MEPLTEFQRLALINMATIAAILSAILAAIVTKRP